MCVCVCVRARVCVCVCVWVGGWVGGCGGVGAGAAYDLICSYPYFGSLVENTNRRQDEHNENRCQGMNTSSSTR